MPASLLLLAAFSLGIVLAVYVKAAFFIFTLFCLSLTIFYFLPDNQRLGFLIFLIFVLGGWLQGAKEISKVNLLTTLAAQKRFVTVKGWITAEATPYSFRFQSSRLKVGTQEQWFKTSFFVKHSRLSVFRQQEQSLSGYFVKKGPQTYFLAKKVLWQSSKKPVAVRQFLRLKQAVFSVYDQNTAALFLALVFGADESVNPEVKQAYLETGLLHLFAASGFNVALASLSLFYFLKWLKAPKYLALSLSLLSLGGYYLLIGPSASVLRASIMTTLMLLAVFIGRPRQLYNLLFLSGLLILIVAPLTLFEISFQLSYAAVLGLAYWQKKLADLFSTANFAVQSLTTTVAAQLGVLPVLLYHFGQLSLIAPLSNLVVLPLVALITVVGFYTAAAYFLFPVVSLFVLKQLKVLLFTLSFLVDTFARLPLNTVTFASKAAFIFSLIFLLWLLLLEYRYREQFKGRLNIFFIVAFLLVILAFNLFLAATVNIGRPQLEAYFLNVGQGDAVVVKVNKAATVLVDGGSSYVRLRNYLQRLKVLKIDLLAVSHSHADHITALSSLINRYKVGAVLVPNYQPKSYLYRQLLAKVKEKKIPLIRGVRGQQLKLAGATVNLFWPAKKPLLATSSDANNNSLVFKLSYKKMDILFMGDAQLEAISRFVKSGRLEAEVLKVSHQGSYNGTTKSLLKQVKPKLAVISVGADNPYGHPHKSTLALLKRFRLSTFRTDKNGTISVTSNGFSFRAAANVLP